MSRSAPLRAALREALSKDARIHAWQIQSVEQSELQSYLVETRLEAERHVESDAHQIAVFVRNGDLVGRASLTITPEDAGRLDARIDEAVFMAGLGGDAPWALPGAGDLPPVELFDPAIADARARDTSHDIVERWRAAVAGHADARPSSMELFCTSNETLLENSAGLTARSRATQVSMLTILIATRSGQSAESVSWEQCRRAEALDVEAVVRNAAEESRDVTTAKAPPSGTYPVVIDANEMAALFTPVQGNASAQGLYQKSSRFEIGARLPIEGSGGEPLVLLSNATAPFGLSSYAFDADGVAGQRVEIVKDDTFVRPWATKQFADYLEVPATGAFANLEIPPGATSLADLLASGERVLHVRWFSWLTPDQARGDFASEIRVGYLHEKGKRTPVKGGTVSGNLFRALGGARYASESVSRGAYLGAAGVRLEGVSVAGA